MPPKMPYAGYPNQPSSQHPQPTPPNHDVLTWLDDLARQQHGWDPRIYSDPRHPYQYPQHPSRNQYPQYPQLPQNVQYAQSAAQNRSNPYPPTFQQGSSSTHHPTASQHQYPPRGFREADDDYSSVDSSPTDAENRGRTKSTIALDPLQPLTVDGKPRERVFVACDRCRIRKLRCDGAKPTCCNCQRVADSGVQCHYDPVPKRRGQDKAPRTRSAIGVRQPRKPAVRKGSQDGQPTPRS